jgi:hypothetical protein
MRTVGGAKGVANENLTKLGEAGAEGGNFLGIGFGGGAILIFDFAFFFNVEAEILEEDDFAGLQG